MIAHLSACMFILVLYCPLSRQHPVPDADDHISKTVQQKAIYHCPEEMVSGGEVDHSRPERHDPEEGMEGEQQLESLKPEAVDTLRKINPLTIASQVSQMMHKEHQKSSGAKPAVRNDQSCISAENPEADPSSAVAVNSEEIKPMPGYIRPQPPRIVNKPRPNDYGYSVIVVAGDPINLPIKVKDTKELEDKENRRNLKQVVSKGITDEEQIHSKEKSSNGEIRVPKEYSVNPDFPVYDNDFNFIPDPFNGILEKNYWKDQNNNDHQKTNLSGEDEVREGHRLKPHSVQVRSSEDVDEANIIDETVSCGTSWRKSNSTATFEK